MSTNTKQESILQEAQRLTSQDRNKDYGSPLDDFSRTAGMMNAWLGDQLRSPLTPEQCAIFMVFVKMSRQRNKEKRDNLVDGAGYIRLIEMMQEEREKRNHSDEQT